MALQPGSEVHRVEPFAVAVLNSHLSKICSWCLKRTPKQGNLMKCAGCKELHYCSVACQREDWVKGLHKKECKLIQAQLFCPCPSVENRLVARIVLQLQNGLAEKKITESSGETYADIGTTHYLKVTKKADAVQDYMDCSYNVGSLFVGKVNGVPQVKPKLAQMIQIAFGLTKKFGTKCPSTEYETGYLEGAHGVSILPEMFGHSCWPNAILVQEGRSLVVRALSQIKDRQDVRLNYAPDWIIPMPLTIQTQGFQGNALLEGNLNPLPLTRRAPIQGSSFLAKSDLSDCKCHDCKMTTTEAKNREKIRLATHNDPSKTPSYPPGHPALAFEIIWKAKLHMNMTKRRLQYAKAKSMLEICYGPNHPFSKRKTLEDWSDDDLFEYFTT